MPATTKPPMPPIRRAAKPIQRDLEMRWIGEHRNEFPGEWVALDGDRLIAHGKDADPVFAAARNTSKIPFLFRCPEDALPSTGGF